jgi:hypothetical protein
MNCIYDSRPQADLLVLISNSHRSLVALEAGQASANARAVRRMSEPLQWLLHNDYLHFVFPQANKNPAMISICKCLVYETMWDVNREEILSDLATPFVS